MKLYATTTSERANKGQGGNEYIKIELSLFDGIIDAGDVELNIVNCYVELDYISQGGYLTTLARFRDINIEKGKKKTGETLTQSEKFLRDKNNGSM